MESNRRMNLTFQMWNGHRYSVLLRQDFKLDDFVIAVNRAGISVPDHLFFISGKALNLEDELQFSLQKPSLFFTYIAVTPRETINSNTLLLNRN